MNIGIIEWSVIIALLMMVTLYLKLFIETTTKDYQNKQEIEKICWDMVYKKLDTDFIELIKKSVVSVKDSEEFINNVIKKINDRQLSIVTKIEGEQVTIRTKRIKG